MKRLLVVSCLMALAAGAVGAQGFRQGWGRFRTAPPRFPDATSFDGSFTFCRGMYTSDRREAGGMGWWTDYPGRRHQLLDPPFRADQGSRQQAARRRTESSRRPSDRRRAVQLPDDPDGGCRDDAVERHRGRAPARVPDEGRLPVRGRLLGRVGVGSVGRRDRPRAAAERIPDQGHHPGPSAVPPDVRHRQAAADPVNQFVDADGRRDVRARRGNARCRTSAGSATRTAG